MSKEWVVLLCLLGLNPGVTCAQEIASSGGIGTSQPQTDADRREHAIKMLAQLRQQAVQTAAAAGTRTTATPVQERKAQSASRMTRGLRRAQIEPAVRDPLGVSAQNSLDPQVTITADKKDGITGHARFALALGDRWGASATFAAPLSSGAATFVDSAGLKSAASIAAAIKYLPQKIDLPVGSGTCTKQLVTDLLAVQGVRGDSGDGTTNQQNVAEVLEWMRLKARAQDPDAVQVKSLVRDLGNNQLKAILDSPTIVASPDRFWTAVSQDPQLVCLRYATPVTIAFEANHYSIDYLGANATRDKFDDTSRAWSVSYGVSRSREWKPEEGKNLLAPVFYGGITVRNGDRISADDDKDLCVPLSGGGSECFTGPSSAPTIGNRRTAVVAEARIWTVRQTAGFNPKYTWAQTTSGHSDTWEVPIYLMRQVTDVSEPDLKFGANLIGGVSPGWRRGAVSGNGWFVTLFLTKPFGLP